jgi:hypothetical protein
MDREVDPTRSKSILSKRRERLIVQELAWNPNRRSAPFRSHFSDPVVHIETEGKGIIEHRLEIA